MPVLLSFQVVTCAAQPRGLRSDARHDKDDSLCDKEWKRLMHCIKHNIFHCQSCNRRSPGIASRDDCDGFAEWHEANVECCENDECGRKLEAFRVCMDCDATTSIQEEVLSVAESPTMAPTKRETDFPTLEPSSSLVPSTQSIAMTSHSPTSISIEGSSDYELSTETLVPEIFTTDTPSTAPEVVSTPEPTVDTSKVPTRRIPLWLPP